MSTTSEHTNEQVESSRKINVLKSVHNLLQGRSLDLQSHQDMIVKIFRNNFDQGCVDYQLQNKMLTESVSTLMFLKTLIETCYLKYMLQTKPIFERGHDVLETFVSVSMIADEILKWPIKCSSSEEIKYVKILEEYRIHRMKFWSQEKTAASTKGKEMVTSKTEKLLRKVNVARSIKLMLISAFSDRLKPETQSFLSPIKRNLTLKDFEETWTVGFPDPETSHTI